MLFRSDGMRLNSCLHIIAANKARKAKILLLHFFGGWVMVVFVNLFILLAIYLFLLKVLAFMSDSHQDPLDF